MKTRGFRLIKSLLILLLMASPSVYAQDTPQEEKPVQTSDNKPIKSTFEHGVLINNQTVMNPNKKTLDFIIQHRFGIIEHADDLGGLYAPSNIRLGFDYGITDRLAVGIGATKNKKLYDLNWKYAILKQTKSGNIPVSVSYFGNAAISGLDKEVFLNQENKYKGSNRFSYFHELMIARKVNSHLSLQAAFTYSHFNLVDSALHQKHDNYGLSFIGRYQFTPQSSIIVEYDHPLTTWYTEEVTEQTDNSTTILTTYYPKPNLGLGWEIATSGHQFQIFVCTTSGILGQEFFFNQNDFTKREILIGFNITRQWGF